jgi:hypothetical protein
MPFNKTHLINWLAQQQLISEFQLRVSHAGSTKATQSFLFFLCTIFFPIIESWLLPLLFSKLQKTEKWSTFSSLHLKPPHMNEWMNGWISLNHNSWTNLLHNELICLKQRWAGSFLSYQGSTLSHSSFSAKHLLSHSIFNPPNFIF